jgi:hypothetical protein
MIEAELIEGVVDDLDEMDEIDAPEEYDVEWPTLPAKFYDENGDLIFERDDLDD